MELAENVLPVAVRTRFVTQLDRWWQLRRASPPAPIVANPAAARFLTSLARCPEPFGRLLALDGAILRETALAGDDVSRLVGDSDPAVREMAALHAVSFQSEGWRSLLESLRGDADVRVRAYVEYALATGRTGMSPADDMYTTLEKVLFLQNAPLFADVAPEQLVSLARVAEVERVATEHVVFKAGDAGDALFFVMEGRVCVGGDAGVEVGVGEMFGEMSVLDSAPHVATARVVEDAVLMRIAREDFYEELHSTAEIAEAVIRVLVQRLRSSARKQSEADQ